MTRAYCFIVLAAVAAESILGYLAPWEEARGHRPLYSLPVDDPNESIQARSKN